MRRARLAAIADALRCVAAPLVGWVVITAVAWLAVDLIAEDLVLPSSVDMLTRDVVVPATCGAVILVIASVIEGKASEASFAELDHGHRHDWHVVDGTALDATQEMGRLA